ncbi:MAG: PAS domain S-box protein [Rhodoferax sp.]|nr:PAS domain S-box protein [Rhodoferax sp.]
MNNPESTAAEPLLWEGQEDYLRLVKNIQVGIVVNNALGEVIYANPRAGTMLGMPDRELPGKTLVDPQWPRVSEDGAPYGWDEGPLALAIRTRQPVRDVVVGIDNLIKGKRLWFMVSADPELRADGSVLSVTCIFFDVSKRIEAEHLVTAGRNALREAALHTQAILDNMVDAVITIDSAGLMRTFNQAAGPMFGYTPEEVIGQHINMLIPEPRKTRNDGQRSHYQDIGAAHMLGRPREMWGRRKDGSVFPVSLAVTRYPYQGETTYIGLVRDITDARRITAELQANAQQLQEMSQHVLHAQETERRRIARELHDELGQSLTAMKINLQSSARFKGASTDEMLAENLLIVEDALQQVRRLATALRPSVLDDLGLVPALRGLAEQTATRSGFAVHFHPALPDRRLPPDIETACFRIAQEALTNVARYAKAKRVDIDLFHDRDDLILGVRDDGCGFDVAAMQARARAGSSMGVLGMQERALLLGGTLEIESATNLGSTVRLRCPMFRPTNH